MKTFRGIGLMVGVWMMVMALVSVVSLASRIAYAAGPTNEQVLVDQAQIALQEFMADPDMAWMHDAIKNAEGVMVVPNMYKAGLLVGGSGGKGVFFVKDAKTGGWTGPAFYNMGSANIGLQIGAEKSEVVILAMTKEAVDALLKPSAKLGVDASVAAGPVGAGASGSTTQLPKAAFLSFARSKGAFAGLTFEGAVIKSDKDSNRVYYGKKASATDILVKGKVKSAKADGMREELKKASGGAAE